VSDESVGRAEGKTTVEARVEAVWPVAEVDPGVMSEDVTVIGMMTGTVVGARTATETMTAKVTIITSAARSSEQEEKNANVDEEVMEESGSLEYHHGLPDPCRKPGSQALSPPLDTLNTLNTLDTRTRWTRWTP
jgi:hypothetical protein